MSEKVYKFLEDVWSPQLSFVQILFVVGLTLFLNATSVSQLYVYYLVMMAVCNQNKMYMYKHYYI